MKKPRLVYIKWRDPVSLVAWATEKEILEWAAAAAMDGGMIESVGWIFFVSDNYVVFAPHRALGADQTDQPNMSDAHKIPLTNILEVRTLSIGDKWNGWRPK